MATKSNEPVIEWLLEETQPSVRFLTMTRLLATPESDTRARAAQQAITKTGWAAEILSRQTPEGVWVSDKSLYTPKYLSTNWMLLVLSELGVTRDDARVARACETWIRRLSTEDGGFSPNGGRRGHLCTLGNTTRALIRFGYLDHPRVRSAFEWLVQNQAKLGGWSCFASGRNLDSWEGLSAFAVYPRARWTSEMETSVQKAAEFYLSRELHIQGDHYEPWFRFHFPVHYYYDLLVGLDFMTTLGYGGDPRLQFALRHLKTKRRRDGRWNLDAVHPDVEGAMAEWFRKHPKDRPTPFALETPGAPSKMVTLTALRVLSRVRDPAGEVAQTVAGGPRLGGPPATDGPRGS